jgi:hypothetical protein
VSLAAAAIAAVLSAIPNADTPPPPGNGVTINVVGECPDATDVRRVIGELVPPDAANAAPVTVNIEDRGPHVRIAVRKAATTLTDPTRDCAARARMAAAFAATELLASRIVLGPPDWTIEKGVVFEIASTPSGWVLSPGAEFRGAYGGGRWSLYGAAGARGPATLTLDHGWEAELLRFPLDAGARLTGHWWRFRPWLTLAGSLTITGIMGSELVQTEREWRGDVGALVMAGTTLKVTDRFGLSAALTVRWQPRRYQLKVVPAGTVGETPAWWFGLALDYTIDAKRRSPP